MIVSTYKNVDGEWEQCAGVQASMYFAPPFFDRKTVLIDDRPVKIVMVNPKDEYDDLDCIWVEESVAQGMRQSQAPQGLFITTTSNMTTTNNTMQRIVFKP